MGKHQCKVQKALDRRIKEKPTDNKGLHYVTPGSQNKRKGWG